MKSIRWLQRQSIALWIVVIFLIIIFPVNILLILSTSSYIHELENQTVLSCRSVMDLYLLRLENQMTQMEVYLYTLETEDSDFIKTMEGGRGDAATLSAHSTYRRLDSNLAINQYDGFYFFMTEDEAVKYVVPSAGNVSNTTKVRKYLEQKQDSLDDKYWNYAEIDGAGYIIRMYRSAEHPVYYGAILSMDGFLEEFLRHVEYEYLDAAVVRRGEQKDMPEGIVIAAESGRAPVGLTVCLDQKAVYASLPLLRRVEYQFSFGCLLLIPLLILLFQRILVRPLKDIEEALHQMEQGRQDYRIRRHFSSRELMKLGESYNRMADQIRYLKIESYEKELEKNRIQMKNIQLQVRPHFLLNLFHLVFSMAEIRNYKGVQEITLYLSKYFRHLFSEGDMHTIGVELELVKGYFQVVEAQYPDCFEVTYEIDQTLTDRKIPTLLVHSLVENISKYAISLGSYITIDIKICRKDGAVCIVVEDDGPGIGLTALKEIQAGQPVLKADGNHVGLKNARERLCMLCGREAAIRVESQLFTGTRVTVTLPEEGGKSDESAAG